ncbi:MAG: M67 family metallopeptidase [Sneathiella sp.]|nr:M67 family metallopeptidase [Sneathiella sp.]
MSLSLTFQHLDQLDQHCKKCWPEEACALLVGTREIGDDRIVNRVVLSDNVAVDKKRYFEIDPSVRIRLEVELRGGVEDIIGVFHSHPEGPAEPSKADERMVIETQFLWLIAATSSAGTDNIGAFEFSDEKKFKRVPLIKRGS